MDKTGIIFGILALIIVFGVFQLIFPNFSAKIFPNFQVKIFSLGFGNSDNNQNSSNSSNQNGADISYSGPRPQTIIIFGPADGEKISRGKVVFRFAYSWSGSSNERIYFESKLEGVDDDWQETSNDEREITLLPGRRSYNFQVRVKTENGIVDLSPAVRNFWADLSDDFGRITISSAQAGSFPYSIMKISLRNQSEDKVNLANWKLTASQGVVSISSAVEIYNPSLGSSNAGDLILNPYGYVNVYSVPSPISLNFQLNLCSGYLNNIYDFNPDLPNDCPRLDREELSAFSPACREYLYNLGACQSPDPNELNKFASDANCRYFADQRLNYPGCLKQFRFSPGFLKNEWLIFSDRNILNNDHERLILKDASGFFVDAYEY